MNEFDVAKYILEKEGAMSAMKLQKLMYYCQAWSMVWDERPLFDADFEAWANGPVLSSIYEVHRGLFSVDASLFSTCSKDNIDADGIDTINSVLKVYGNKTAQWLSNLTHEEAPWKDTRGDLAPLARSNAIISKGDMHLYYSGL